MNLLGGILLLLFTLAWALVPLIPALREYFRPTDVEPLTMVGRDNADIGRFARNFREYLTMQLEGAPALSPAADDWVTLPDGTPLLRPPRVTNELTRSGLPAGASDRLVVLDQSTVLEQGEAFRLEVWARDDFFGSPGATYRALLGEENIELGEGSVSLRWIHSAKTLVTGPRGSLYGRTSAGESIQLGRSVRFERLGAPLISAGPAGARAMPPLVTEPKMFLTPPNARRLGDHLRIEGDFTLGAGVRYQGNLVVAGALVIEPGARLAGSVKAEGDLRIGAGAVIEGSAVSRADIQVGQDCWIRGPVISEELVHVGPGATIGTPEAPTTVSAREVFLSNGAVVSGQIVTVEGGLTAD